MIPQRPITSGGVFGSRPIVGKRIGITPAVPAAGGGAAAGAGVAGVAGVKRTLTTPNGDVELSSDGRSYKFGEVQVDSSMGTINNKKARFNSIDPQGRADVVPDPTKAYGPEFMDKLVTKIIENANPITDFLRVVAGITNMKDLTGSTGPGGVDSITTSIANYEKALEEASAADNRGGGPSNLAKARNSVILGGSSGSQLPLTNAEKTFARELAGGLDNNGVPITPPSLSGVPTRLLPSIISNIPRQNFSSKEEIIKEYLLNGKMDKNVLDATDALFPKSEGKAFSLKFAFDPVLSGFSMINPIIKAQADSAVAWLRDELVDPSTGTSPFFDVNFLASPVMAYSYPQPFGMLVGRLIQSNNTLNGMPVNDSARHAIARGVDEAINSMLRVVTNHEIKFQGTRGYTRNKRDEKRPWIGR